MAGSWCYRLAAVCGAMALCASPLQAKTCTAKQADAADRQIDQLDSWRKMDAFTKQFGHCDDGGIAEGASEAVARLLVDHWTTLPALARLSKRNPRLTPFVMRHLDGSLNVDDLEKITQLSTRDCPDNEAGLCASLAEAISRQSSTH